VKKEKVIKETTKREIKMFIKIVIKEKRDLYIASIIIYKCEKLKKKVLKKGNIIK
jgi:hypothetical protein